MASIVDAPWMTAPATRAVVDALTAEGADVRFVGGCVRDALLGRESDDIDIGTPDPPECVMALLKDAGIETRTVPRGIAHGTVTALAGGGRYEITTLRHDERTDGRHAVVAFTDDWRQDAARRDFTINAMSLSPGGALHDYFGGQADLKAGRVRFVGDPATRIAEDHLRILRFFRFYAWYGQGKPDDDALAACKVAAHTLSSLSGERVQAEAMKLLAAPDPISAVAAMQDVGVLVALLPEAQGTERLARRVAIEEQDVAPDPLRRLAVLLDGADADAANDVCERWRLSADNGSRLAALVADKVDPKSFAVDAAPATFHVHVPPPEVTLRFAPINPDLDCRGQRRLLYRLGAELFSERVLDAWSAEGGDEHEAVWRMMLETANAWTKPVIPVQGADVLTRGIPEGPEVGQLLRAVEDWWIESDFAPGRAKLLERLDALVAKRPKE